MQRRQPEREDRFVVSNGTVFTTLSNARVEQALIDFEEETGIAGRQALEAVELVKKFPGEFQLLQDRLDHIDAQGDT